MFKTYRKPIESKLVTTILLVLTLTVILWQSEIRPLARISGRWATTSSERYSFQIDYPAKWVPHHYGEFGWHGDEEIKLRISGIDEGFNGIYVWWIPLKGASIEEVSNLGKELIIQDIKPVVSRGEPGFTELDYYKSVIQDTQVIRRKYTYGLAERGSIDEHVYIARVDDVIIISLETSGNNYESYIDTFETIIQSFQPLD